MAQLALHQCVECTYYTDEKNSNEIAEICYSYEFLDDFVAPKPTVNGFLSECFRSDSKDKHYAGVETIIPNGTALEEMAPKFSPTVQSLQYADDESAKDKSMFDRGNNFSWLQERFDPKNHPLELMVSFK